jgi:hypothetical protein
MNTELLNLSVLKKHGRASLYGLLILLCTPVVYAYTSQAEVVKLRGECSYFMLQSDKGFMTLKLQDGPRPQEGDILEGHMDSFGISYVMNRDTGRVSWIYMDDKWSDEDSAKQKFKNKCK